MPVYNRGGKVLKTGKIGRVNVLRQQFLLPGERISPSLEGEIRLTALRERETIPVHARIDAFLQPVRWLWADWPDFIKEGPATTKAIPEYTIPAAINPPSLERTSDYGVGSASTGNKIFKFFRDAPLRIWNEWYKWPEEADETDWVSEGLTAVNLPHSWTRLQKYDGIMSADSEQATTGDKFDVRDLAELQGRFRNAIERDWIGHGRYVDLLKQCWNAQGSREVDKVPIRLNGADAGVDPRTLWATDSGGLGSTASIYDFQVNHRFGNIAMPEHMILTYMLVVRFAPVAEDEINPLAVSGGRNYQSLIGDPGMLAVDRPQPVREDEITNGTGTSVRGYLPAGWQYRAKWNVIGRLIDTKDTFPLISSIVGQSASGLRDSSRINSAFLSSTLGDYFADLEFNEPVDSPIGGPSSSLYAGSEMRGGSSAYPYPGPRRVV